MRAFIGAVVLAGLATAAAGQDAVTYKPYPNKVGDKTRTTKTEDNTTATTFTVGGNRQAKNERKKKTQVYVTEVLDVGVDATKPAKLRRTYEKAVLDTDGTEAQLPLHGKTVTVEKKGDKYAFTADGAPLDARAAAELEQEFNKEGNFNDNIFPKTPVKPGDTWDLTDTFLKEFGGDKMPFAVDPKGTKVTGKLVGTAKKGASVYGDIEVTADLALAELRGPMPIKLTPGSRWEIRMTGVGVVDGTSPEGISSGTMKISIDGAVNGAALKVVSDVKMTSKTEWVGK